MTTKYTITKDDLHIIDSYKVEKKAYHRTYAQIKALHPDSDVWKRSYKSLDREWATHTLFYDLHLFRSHTKDVDLNYPQKLWEVIGYGIVGRIALIFIK